MPDQPPKTSPMKPGMPQVPGVPKPAPQGAAQPASKPGSTARLLLGIAAFLVVGAIVAWVVLRPASKQNRSAAAQSSPDKSAPDQAQPSEAPRHPVGTATTQELAQPWSFKTFRIRQSLTDTTVAAMIIRLPEGAGKQTQSYWAFSLQEPFGSCSLEYLTDLSRLSSEYRFPAQHPMVVNPCKGAVYDPLQMATLPTGAWVRGAIVHGAALRPPMAIDLRIEGDQIIAVQME